VKNQAARLQLHVLTFDFFHHFGDHSVSRSGIVGGDSIRVGSTPTAGKPTPGF
jgi:hypothetical protein